MIQTLAGNYLATLLQLKRYKLQGLIKLKKEYSDLIPTRLPYTTQPPIHNTTAMKARSTQIVRTPREDP